MMMSGDAQATRCGWPADWRAAAPPRHRAVMSRTILVYIVERKKRKKQRNANEA